ncbi:hypothetical protein [Paractinoplanes durhamensis]|uniref:Uncharacterized protein n=1 Tax=Paractinoplanes durhamensis TaxID=113563 RepID=A0ABQ3YW98_9ACTN|nr:hypothetical protein [Actinoplanes durhamensis]GIE01823.1 hypothetical protein Adu01nite_31730 [Actinoplanes durhamensis]
MRRKRLWAGAAAGVTALVVVGGCAEQIKSLEPKLELRSAAQHLAEAKQAGFTVKVTGSADDLITALKAEAAKDKDSGPVDEDVMRKLFNSSATIAYDQAGDGADDDRSLLAATIDGVTGTEIRLVDKTLYAKAPVNELAKKFGESAADIDEIKSEMGANPGFGTLFDGGWISVDLKEAASLGQSGFGLPAENLDSQKTITELKTGAQNLFDGASVVRDTADKKHLVVTSSTTKAYAEVKRIATAVSSSDAADLTEDLGEAPKDRPIVLDLWVDNGKLTALEVNLLQFIDGATGRAAVRLEVTTGSEIAAPEGAKKLDTKALVGTDPTTDSATGIADMLGYSAMDLAEEDGGKPADHLKEAIADLAGSPYKAKIIKRGVAEVTVGGSKACLTLPSSTAKAPKVVKGTC